MSDVYTFPCGCCWPQTGPALYPGGPPRVRINYRRMPICSAVKGLFASGATKGVFQLEERLGQTWAKRVAPENQADVAALTSILRPGCLKSRDEAGDSVTSRYAKRKGGLQPCTPLHDCLSPILDKTYNEMLFQEDLLRIAREVAGFDLAGADTLRKCVTDDTRFVSKTRGWVTIRRLLDEGYQDDLFLVMGPDGKQHWKGIDRIWQTGRHDVRTVRSDSGFAVHATKHHQFLTSTGWKARMRLQPGEDRLVVARRVEWDGRDVLSDPLCMVVAGVLTEGYFVEHMRGTFVNHDPYMMRVFTDSYSQVFGSPPAMSADGRVAYITGGQKAELAKYVEYGKSATRRLPPEMMGATLETTRRFLSFILAAEGGTTQATGSFDFSSKSSEFAEQVKLLLLRFGVPSNMYKKLNPKYGYFWTVAVATTEARLALRRELAVCWPQSKIDDFDRATESLGRADYTTGDLFPAHLVKSLVDQYPLTANYEGGSVYKRPISRGRFQRLAERTGDAEWVRLATGGQAYDTVEAVEKHKKQAPVYDFTVAGGDTPYIIANGMVIHNSVGKKDVQLLASLKDKFLAGCASVGKLPADKAVLLWEQITKSGRYLFSLNHAWSYGGISIKTAYVKAHYPVPFYAGWIGNAHLKADSDDEVKELVADARAFGVRVRCPDLRLANPRVAVDRGEVVFGLCDVSGAGRTAVDKLLRKVEDMGGAAGLDWPSLLVKALPSVSSTVASNLMAAGAFDFTGVSRLRQKAEYDAWRQLSDGERKWVTANLGGSLADTVRAGLAGKMCRGDERKDLVGGWLSFLDKPPTSLDDTPRVLAALEEKVLGVAVTCSRLHGIYTGDRTHLCGDLDGCRDRHVRVAVEVDELRVTLTKAGDPMGWLTLADESGPLQDVVVFKDGLADYRDLLRETNAVLVDLEASKRGGWVVQSVRQL